MRGTGHALVHESQPLIEPDEPVLAGQHQPRTSCGAGVLDRRAQQHARIPMVAVFGRGIHAEDHLPGAVLVMHRGVLVHLVSQVRLVGHEPVDERDESAIPDCVASDPGVVRLVAMLGRRGIHHQPEVIRIHGQSRVHLALARRLGCRETGGLHRCDSRGVIQCCMSDSHGHYCSRPIVLCMSGSSANRHRKFIWASVAHDVRKGRDW